ncbi:dCTP deaminase [Candidatus Micrarchaeota archaeon]|nr:dCTP deaminase [Candidatus Micrarchaeota archaeon]
MTILSKNAIKEYMKKGKIKFEPNIKESQIDKSSVDLTLDSIFWVFKDKYINSKKPICLDNISYTQVFKKVKKDFIILKSQEMCLGITKEKILIDKDIAGRLEGRSRYARMGLTVHITSSIHHPGSKNAIVLEIVNVAPFPIKLSKGMHVSQIVFHKVE